jgi:tyrosine-protein kinase Etk/Wzc
VTPTDVRDVLLRGSWMIAVGLVIGAILGYAITPALPRVYAASATLLVLPSAATQTEQGLTPDQVVATYAQLLQSRPVVEAGLAAAAATDSYASVASSLDVFPLRGTLLLQLTLRGANASNIASVVNQVAMAAIRQSQQAQQSALAARHQQLATAADELTAQVSDLQARANDLRAQPAGGSRDDELTRTLGQLAQTQQRANAAQNSLAALDLTSASSVDALSIVDPATTPQNPIFPRAALDVAIGAVLGLLLSIVLAIVSEVLVGTIRTPEQIRRRTGVQVVVSVPTILNSPSLGLRGDASWEEDPQEIEAMRRLRASLEFGFPEHEIRSVLLTSVQPGAGGTTIAAGLARAWARARERVALVDANLREPRLDQLFGVDGQPGLTSLLNDAELSPSAVLAPTRIDGLFVLVSGPPFGPDNLVASRALSKRLQQLKEFVDRVVVDGPSITSSDVLAIAAMMGTVLVVLDARNARTRTVRRHIQDLRTAGVPRIGVVLNYAASPARGSAPLAAEWSFALQSPFAGENGPRGA